MLRTTLVRAQRSSTRSIQPLLRKHGRIIYDRNASSNSFPVARYSSSVSSPPRQDLLEAYRELVSSGRLKWDDEQVRIVMKLRHLLNELTDYTPPPELASRLKPFAPTPVDARKPPSWWDKGRQPAEQDDKEKSLVRVLTQEEELANLRTPKGIMVTGPPGTGKSLILSIFFDLLPTSHKKRWHYHAFTLFLYRQVFLEMDRRRNATPVEKAVENMDRASSKGWRSVFANGRWEDGGAEVKGVEKEETIPFVIAKQMIQEYHILYFDEMQLVDASSAALLRDVLSWYWRLGGVIVTCSNRVPDDLYHHGVQKERMVGFLDALKARCEVVELDGGKDWRKGVWADVNKWYRDQREFDAEWTSAGGEKAEPVDLAIYGRRLRVPAAVGTTCRMAFSDLCEQPLGPADYISLASSFSTFFIDAMPILYLKNKNEARRLINLVDALYEARCQVFVQAETDVETLFFPDAVDSTYDTNDSIMAAEALSETLHTAARPNVSSYNPSEGATHEKREETESKAAGAFGVLGIFTGEDERFAYKRAVSRLVEMTTSPTYSREAWIPVSAESRLWETNKATAVPPQILKSAWTTPTPKHGSQDFATEAGYSRPERLTRSPKEEPVRQQRAGPREGAPVITEKHMWGVVEEWGEKVGKWGKGVKAFDDKDKKQ